MSVDDAGSLLADWLDNVLNRVSMASTGERVSKTAGRHTYTPTCTHEHTVALGAGLLGLRCQSQHAENNTSSTRQTSHSPYWKRSRHCWQCLCPPCICDPCEQRREGETEREREIKRKEGEGERWEDIRSDSSRQSKISTNNETISFLPCFSPAGCKQRQKMELCINFVQTSKMTINKRRPELFALSDRNSQQRFRAVWPRPGDKASLSQRKV